MSKADMDDRVGRQKASQFTQEVLKRALDNMEHPEEGIQGGEDPSPDEDDTQGDPDDLFVEQPNDRAEQDLELHFREEELNADGELELEVDREADAGIEEQIATLDYHKLAKEAMTLWLENTMTANIMWKDRPAEEKRCPLCADDVTVAEDQKVSPDSSNLIPDCR